MLTTASGDNAKMEPSSSACAPQGMSPWTTQEKISSMEAARRGAELIRRLLTFSRRQTLDPKPVNSNRLIFDLEELIRRTVGPQIEVETVGKAGIWTTLVDPNQLENALLNLCINARDAMPDGGRITIETANKWLDDTAARERDLEPGQYVSICVTDTGTGMTPEVISRAFDPFFTTKPLGEGTGLGLSMIYGFARQSGGHVRIYSEIGTGTTMCIYLPRHFMEDEGIDDASPPLSCPRWPPTRRRNGAVSWWSMMNPLCASSSSRLRRNWAMMCRRQWMVQAPFGCCKMVRPSICSSRMWGCLVA